MFVCVCVYVCVCVLVPLVDVVLLPMASAASDKKIKRIVDTRPDAAPDVPGPELVPLVDVVLLPMANVASDAPIKSIVTMRFILHKQP